MLQNWSENQSSHYDLIRALDAGRTTIDAGPTTTKDKAFYKGHYYSARAPGPGDVLAAVLRGAERRRRADAWRATRRRCAAKTR